ncbi:MAG: response regulator transcription factor [Lachnospiraceae bacterium]|jgi:DNA-binding response OmpR family regulator|nr:response regulator transcription factor [Lachnospiraceae bacterium]
MNKILIVEDEEAIANLIKMNLKNAGYYCDVSYNGKDGADKMQSEHYDLCLLDIMLPEINGYELLEYAKSIELPVIFLTAKGETADKVKGLQAGADDYITKPFEVLELLARVENILRRFEKTERCIDILDLHIDTVSRSVTKNGVPLKLTYKEFDLLLLFVRNPNVALYREVIYEHVWDSTYMGDSRTVDLHVQRLRKKAGLENQIEAVYKVGYRLTTEES